MLAADMVGCSRLMERDEDDVLRRRKLHRRELIDPEVDRTHGRLIKTTGDGMLVAFESAQDAVRGAISIQSSMARRKEGRADEDRIRYHIGVNLGDLVFDDGDAFGDSVNVAARLEGPSEPGGVCIFDVVHQTVSDRLDAPFLDMGGQRVKNISPHPRVAVEALRASRAGRGPGGRASPAGALPSFRRRDQSRLRLDRRRTAGPQGAQWAQ